MHGVRGYLGRRTGPATGISPPISAPARPPSPRLSTLRNSLRRGVAPKGKAPDELRKERAVEAMQVLGRLERAFTDFLERLDKQKQSAWREEIARALQQPTTQSINWDVINRV